MVDEDGSTVACRISHESLRDHANRVQHSGSDGAVFEAYRAFAGIWEFARLNGEEISSAAMIVGEPNPLVGGVHDRMPVMLLPQDYDAWLGSTTAPEDLRNLLRPYDESLMEAYAVSRKVNSVKNDTEECIEPIVDDQVNSQ